MCGYTAALHVPQVHAAAGTFARSHGFLPTVCPRHYLCTTRLRHLKGTSEHCQFTIC